MSVKLFPHQTNALEYTKEKNRVAYYHDMGLGKTFTGSEKMAQLDKKINLIICQKSKIQDWINHFNMHYGYKVFNLTKTKDLMGFYALTNGDSYIVGVINYELVFRRPELSMIKDFTLMLDESSLIQNEKTKRSKFILCKLQPANVILLSGTPTGGKYEKLYSQLKLLGMPINKTAYYNTYINYHFEDYGFGPKVLKVDGYKNVDRLKLKMRQYGCHFLKTDEVMNLPEQIFTKVKVPASRQYKQFHRNSVVTIGETLLVGDNTLTKMLYERQLCGQYSKEKLEAFRDLAESTDDRLIVFYNFTDELIELACIANELYKPYSIVNGSSKHLEEYEQDENSITFIQYQAGAMGLNLQKANKIIYYSPPLSSELYEQSKKRINRIGQSRTCYYYNLTVSGSIEERIYKVLAMRRDYTNNLFEMEETNGLSIDL